MKNGHKNENKGGTLPIWTEKRIDAICDLFDRFLNKDQFFEDETYDDIANVVPILAHFVSVIGEKWQTVREDYPELADVARPPSKMTMLGFEVLRPQIEIMKVRQERGLLYGSMSGMLSGSTTQLMLQNHGYVTKREEEVTQKEYKIIPAKNAPDGDS